ncbi:MAG TPA: hypothetical protein VHM29_03250, partial [Acidimicrobiia bacterium]|nr:hypothetical protein [Acidimicrobiia bacterium]
GEVCRDDGGLGRHGRHLLPVARLSQPRPRVAFRRLGGGVSDPDAKEAVLGRSGIIWTIVGVLLIIALLIYIF